MAHSIRNAMQELRATLAVLSRYDGLEPTPPEANAFFETWNGSLVFCTRVDSDGDGRACVLVGGHGSKSSSGEKPGEEYTVTKEGIYQQDLAGAEIGMSLLRKVPADLSSFGHGRPSPEGIAAAREAPDELEGDEEEEEGPNSSPLEMLRGILASRR